MLIKGIFVIASLSIGRNRSFMIFMFQQLFSTSVTSPHPCFQGFVRQEFKSTLIWKPIFIPNIHTSSFPSISANTFVNNLATMIYTYQNISRVIFNMEFVNFTICKVFDLKKDFDNSISLVFV